MAEDKKEEKVGIGAAILALLALLFFWKKAKAAPPPLLICPYCRASFATQEELNAHLASVHPIINAGRLYGTIIDAITREPIIGKLVYIDRYPSTDLTNNAGYFICENIPPGTYYTLAVEGYEVYNL